MTTSQNIAIAGIATSSTIGFLSAIVGASSSHSSWASINHYQLLTLIPLVGAYIHYDVLEFIKGFDFITFTFISFSRIPPLKYLYEIFTDKQSNDYLKSIGIEHQNGVMNLIQLIVTILIIGVLHIAVVLPFWK